MRQSIKFPFQGSLQSWLVPRKDDVEALAAEGSQVEQRQNNLHSKSYCIQNPELETQTISFRLDFLKCVQIFIFFKTQICTESVSRFSRDCVDLCYWQENL